MPDYETLRTHVLSGSTLARPAGLVVLLRHGLAAWAARRTASTLSAAPAPRTTTPLVTDDRRAALVPMLVNMVLGTDRQVRL